MSTADSAAIILDVRKDLQSAIVSVIMWVDGGVGEYLQEAMDLIPGCCPVFFFFSCWLNVDEMKDPWYSSMSVQLLSTDINGSL